VYGLTKGTRCFDTHLPEFGTDLVTALSALDVNDFTASKNSGGNVRDRAKRKKRAEMNPYENGKEPDPPGWKRAVQDAD